MKKGNEHFREEEWVDFMNGQSPREKTEAIQGHLDSGCQACGLAAGVWRSVHELGRRESGYEPPEWVLRYVRNSFSVAAKQENRSRGFQIPRLVFDSLWRPALAGVRSDETTSRQLRYQSGDGQIELRVEPEFGSERISVTGQYSSTKSQRGTAGVAGMQVQIGGSFGKIAETSTNQFGEFQFSFLPEREMNLYLRLPSGKDLAIPLDVSGMA